jgi:hypothetical protein
MIAALFAAQNTESAKATSIQQKASLAIAKKIYNQNKDIAENEDELIELDSASESVSSTASSKKSKSSKKSSRSSLKKAPAKTASKSAKIAK